MSVRQVVLCLVSVVGLSGCASYTFQKHGYYYFAYRMSAIDSCPRSGYMSPDVAATGKQILKQRFATATFDKNLLDQEYGKLSSRNYSIEQCRGVSVDIAEWRQTLNQQQQEINEMNRAAENFKNSMPKHTYCNRIGTQVFCNSY